MKIWEVAITATYIAHVYADTTEEAKAEALRMADEANDQFARVSGMGDDDFVIHGEITRVECTDEDEEDE